MSNHHDGPKSASWDFPPPPPAAPVQAWPSPGAMAPIPPFKLPDPPAPEPESASVQMLRELLDSRRSMWRDETDRGYRTESLIQSSEEQLENLRRIAADSRVRATALGEEIERILADIKKLGGRKE